MVEIARDSALDVPHEQAHDLIVDLRGTHALGDLGVELFGVQSGGPDGRQVDVTARGGDGAECHARARQIDQ